MMNRLLTDDINFAKLLFELELTNRQLMLELKQLGMQKSLEKLTPPGNQNKSGPLPHPPENQAGVGAAESERIGKGNVDAALLRGLGNKV